MDWTLIHFYVREASESVTDTGESEISCVCTRDTHGYRVHF